ncbi:MAG: polyprenol phosphomannose-dependent alpha 1,6 mannosyltransferase MptB [Streptosporangiaceae bacterium]
MTRRSRGRTGPAGLAAIGASVALTVAVAAAGPSVMEPGLPGRPGQPPWSLGAHPSAYLVVGLTAAALAAGTLGLVLVLRAIRRGWSVPARLVLIAGLLAAAALTLLPPFGSSDQLSYAAYGRMLVTGHNPYTTTPAQLAALGDPVARAVQDWFTTPSVYGPLATGIQGLASLIGGTSVRLTVFVLGLANLAAFAVTALLLHRMTRSDPVRQRRAAVLWACNPLLLQVLVAGAHVDGQAAVFGVAAVAVLFGPWKTPVAHYRRASGARGDAHASSDHLSGPWYGRLREENSSLPRAASSRVPSLPRALVAGALVGLGFAVKVSDVLIGLGLAVALVLGLRPAWRRMLPALAAFGAGFLAVAGAAVAIGGSAMLDQSSRASDMVSIGSPWRVIRSGIHLVVGGTAATDIVKAGAIALAVVLAVLLVRGLPCGSAWPTAGAQIAGDAAGAQIAGDAAGTERAGVPAGYAAVGVTFALVLAWLFAWPYVLPWYDTLAWALLPLVPLGAACGSALDGLYLIVLARTAALGFGYLPARQADVTLPAGLTWLQPLIRHGVTPAVLAAATVWLVVLMLRSRSPGRPLPDGTGGGDTAADPAVTAPEAARPA